MKKRIFALVLALCLCLALLPGAAMAVAENDLLYLVPDTNITLLCEIKDDEVCITDCNTDASGELEIPEQIDSKPVVAIGYGAFQDCEKLISVVIPNSVTTIGWRAFDNCTSLTNINIPNSVTTIGWHAFENCTSLTNINIPNSVSRISSSAFEGCIGLSNVNIPNSVTSIDNDAFHGCIGLTNIIIPNSVTSIYDGAFMDCSRLKSITIPNSVTKIGSIAFLGCTNLMSVTIPYSVKEIYSEAFGYETHSKKYDGLVISGCSNSAAETYAIMNDIEFNVIHIPMNVSAVEPTCTEPGHGEGIICESCGVALTEQTIIPALGHDFDTDYLSDATGHWHICKRCDEKLDTGAHEFGKWVVIKAATATAAGSRERSCTVCEYKETETIPATGSGTGGGSFTPPPVVIAPQPSVDEISVEDIYTDVDPAAWYIDAVAFVTEKGLMNGTDEGSFAPDRNLTRAMLAQILYNNESRPAVSGGSFDDVESGAWYVDAVTWAARNGIISGYGGGKFGPNDNITREQLAVMLWRYAGQPASGAALDKFADIGDASDYALPALRWAVEKGIINGKGNGVLDPAGYATRAEVAQVLMSYFK